MKHLRRLLCVVVLATLIGCDSSGKTPTPATSSDNEQILPSSTIAAGSNSNAAPAPNSPNLTVSVAQPSRTAVDYLQIETPTVAPSDAATATIAAELQGTAIASVDATSTPDANGMSPFAGIDGIAVMRLTGVPAKGEYWLAYSTGSRRVDEITQKHFVIAFQRASNSWREITRIELDNPDYMSEGSIMQTNIEPSHTWISVESGVGAHGGCFDLLSFDGKVFRDEVSGCASSPGAGFVEDLDGDGYGEVVLDATDNYVFCYACGVKRINYSVLHWDGSKLTPVQISYLPDDAPTQEKQLNDRAVDLYKHELMKDALSKIEEARVLAPTDTTVAWNHMLIKLHAQARQAHIAESGYPLLTNIFYGDYPAAVDVLRNSDLEHVMDQGEQSPLVAGTPAEGNAPLLVSYITSTASLALEAEPDLASAYFLRGWANYVAGEHQAEAVADMEKAVAMNPADKFFNECLEMAKH